MFFSFQCFLILSKILDEQLPVHQITDKEIWEFCKKGEKTNKTKVIWIGHSTVLINFENKIILIDPIFSERASPISFIGKKRFRPVPILINQIPRVDVVLITHNHYDHLDYESIMNLNEKFDVNGISWFVGAGTAQWFMSVGININIFEFNWWQSKKFKDLEFVFTPAQHWSQRGLNDENKVYFTHQSRLCS
jgi:N-acyl-phosphatidylethanolamine-hydrolysing phospholipase D